MFVKWLLAIPHLLILYALGTVVQIIWVIAFFAVLFTTKYPRSLFDFVVNVYRWQTTSMPTSASCGMNTHPFLEPDQYPVTFNVDYPTEMNRWLPLVKWLLALPHYTVLVASGSPLYWSGSLPGSPSSSPASFPGYVRLHPRYAPLERPRGRLYLPDARRIPALPA